jgi:hypothetical protein
MPRSFYQQCLMALILLSLLLYWWLVVHFFDDLRIFANKTSRNVSSWTFRNETLEWCYQDGNSNQHPGLLFVKVPKTASSTLAGINIRIARKVGERTLPKGFFFNKNIICSHSFHHGRDLLLQKRANQLVWSFVRDPAVRAQSAFFHFQVSRKGVWPTIGHLINYMSEESSNFQFLYLSKHTNPKQLLQIQHHDESSLIREYVLNEYDFLGIVERWTESLAVMVLLWNLQVEDVIVLSSKLAGGYDDGRYQKAGCVKIQRPSVAQSKDDKTYLQSYLNTTFHQENTVDYELYAMADQRLTTTIQSLGVERVREVQQRIKKFQSLIKEHCLPSALFPCSSNGTWQYEKAKDDCYWFDSGCGYPCIDQVLLGADKN